jgi:uncharacterized protein (DUF2141 family)
MTQQTIRIGPAAALFLALGLCSGAPSLARAQGAPLVVEVRGVTSNEGKVRVDVCTAATFLKTTCPFSGDAPAVAGTTSVTVGALPPGTYAVQAYHDSNDNGRLDRGAFGIPREGFGFSNDAPVGFKGPSFPRAAFVHGAEAQTITLKLRHFGGASPPAPG